MSALLLKILIAHTIADFAIQPEHWIEGKLQKKHRSKYLYYHIGVHFIALLFALGFDWKYWLAVPVIIISHYLIDLAKIHLNGKVDVRILFTLDQMAHIAVILAMVNYYEALYFDLSFLQSPAFLLLLLALLIVTFVCAIIIRQLMSTWKLEEIDQHHSLEKAGKYIGMLERLFVFGFIALDQWQAIGFLIAAKSVFRFGDLSRANDRKLTEYILIGTLLSFGMAIIIGLIYRYLILQYF